MNFRRQPDAIQTTSTPVEQTTFLPSGHRNRSRILATFERPQPTRNGSPSSACARPLATRHWVAHWRAVNHSMNQPTARSNPPRYPRLSGIIRTWIVDGKARRFRRLAALQSGRHFHPNPPANRPPNPVRKPLPSDTVSPPLYRVGTTGIPAAKSIPSGQSTRGSIRNHHFGGLLKTQELTGAPERFPGGTQLGMTCHHFFRCAAAFASGWLRRADIGAMHGLLPDVSIYICRYGFLLFLGEWWRGKAGKYRVEDKDFNVRLGLFFLPEAVKFRQPRLDRLKQIPARLLHALPLGFPKIVFLEQVEDGEFVLAESLLDSTLLLLIKLGYL